MLDQDIACLYEVETKQLKRAVRRNIDRFPTDFMFELDKEEFQILRSQTGTSNWKNVRYAPMAFTEQGVAMLSSVLKSDRAVKVNIAIMRAFVYLRNLTGNYQELVEKIEKMESKYDAQFYVIFDAIKQLMKPPEKSDRKMGFE